jgi:hypothetical protein
MLQRETFRTAADRPVELTFGPARLDGSIGTPLEPGEIRIQIAGRVLGPSASFAALGEATVGVHDFIKAVSTSRTVLDFTTAAGVKCSKPRGCWQHPARL